MDRWRVERLCEGQDNCGASPPLNLLAGCSDTKKPTSISQASFFKSRIQTHTMTQPTQPTPPSQQAPKPKPQNEECRIKESAPRPSILK
mmetsp:Transcript_7817/g.29257  ORF Transcript_7817/g.29257 Transcript_7817/m.29257 type:complete len:89 (+) Transcript_7817:5144-5410(+)